MTDRLPYPPPWQDISTLCAHICISPTTVDVWVRQGLLPPPKLKGGKRLWKWSEVDARLAAGDEADASSSGSITERIRNATEKAAKQASNAR